MVRTAFRAPWPAPAPRQALLLDVVSTVNRPAASVLGNPNVPTIIRYVVQPAECLPAGLSVNELTGRVTGRATAEQPPCDAELRAVDTLSGDYLTLQRLSFEVVRCHAGTCANGGVCTDPNGN